MITVWDLHSRALLTQFCYFITHVGMSTIHCVAQNNNADVLECLFEVSLCKSVMLLGLSKKLKSILQLGYFARYTRQRLLLDLCWISQSIPHCYKPHR